jgi:putative transferase (TIGR04331 family)
MKKLIINPKKTSSNHDDENIFLQKCFLNYLSENYLQRINYSILSKKNFEIDHEIKQIKQNKEIYNEILIELFPILNKLNKVSWSYKTWNFFIGHWLYLYISIIRNRIDLVKPVINSGINYDEQIKIGKNTSLLCNDVRNFTFNCGLIEWNEKLFSRLLYIMHTRNFKNDANLLNSAKSFKKKNEKFLSKAIYILKINTIKFFARLICFKNNYLFYNSYINNKFKLLKIILELGDIPFMHSFSFFNNKIAKEEIDISLRKKIKLNIESKNSDIKILKFLLMELLPTIYLEGFQIQKKLADNSHLPKKIKKVFVSHAYPDNSFKFWLADKINSGTKLVHGQHGAGYNIYKDFFATFHELGISDFFSHGGGRTIIKK